jgi:glycosyltransferase involved in cell wall biosynthesis
MKILVSNGSHKFHLATLAAELSNMGNDVRLMTTLWPKEWRATLARGFPASSGARRFLDRKEDIPDRAVVDLIWSEALTQAGDLAGKLISGKFGESLYARAHAAYSAKTSKLVRSFRPQIYHFRSAFGLGSIQVAEKNGVPHLCDHSIAYPTVLQFMEAHGGSWPTRAEFIEFGELLSRSNRLMKSDLDNCKHVLVNSDFVKSTCVFAGMQEQNIHVVYLGIDERFFHSLRQVINQRLPADQIIFAGGWQPRKGIATLIAAMQTLPPNVKLNIAGADQDTVSRSITVPTLTNRVRGLGYLPRSDLANVLQQHSIMVFPSLCEGSARVVFEALAAGCFVITTPNSGSIVEHEVHGLVVPPGNPTALAEAILRAVAQPDWVRTIGERNARLVANSFRQANYASNVLAIYEKVLCEAEQSRCERR